MDTKPLVVGNWKMELSHRGGVEVMRTIASMMTDVSPQAEVVICPSFPLLSFAYDELTGRDDIAIGAQNIHWEDNGAWTGQVSIRQVKDFVRWCIVGHSEVRALYGLQESTIGVQMSLVMQHGVQPIVCIGESHTERDSGATVPRITEQVQAILGATDRSSMPNIVIAYEPIWAIGSGELPDPNEVSEVVLLIRKLITARFDEKIANRVRILYGGSVKPDNVARYVGEPVSDGVLVGGASVHPMQFIDIIKQVDDVYF